MTPKEKAQYIFDIYTNYVGEYDVDKHAKQCALIAVDEIKETLRECCDEEVLGIYMIYWSEVKQEVEKL